MYLRHCLLAAFGIYPTMSMAATQPAMASSGMGLFKVVLALLLVLAVLGFISWAAKRVLPTVSGKPSAVQVVGGVSVGSRERVVVLQIAGRWIVVGVAPGQVNGIANLEIGDTDWQNLQAKTTDVSSQDLSVHAAVPAAVRPLVKPFAVWIRQAAEKAKTKLNQGDTQ